MLIERKKKKKKLFSSDELHLPTIRYRIELKQIDEYPPRHPTKYRAYVMHELTNLIDNEASTRVMIGNIEREKRP